jgi:hypothetical protein
VLGTLKHNSADQDNEEEEGREEEEVKGDVEKVKIRKQNYYRM